MVLEKYENLTYTEDAIKTAKEDRSNLNKFKEAIDKRRKEIKKLCLKPYEEFEKRIKEYPSLLKYDVFNTRRIKIYRASKGILVKIHPLLHKISDKLNHVR